MVLKIGSGGGTRQYDWKEYLSESLGDLTTQVGSCKWNLQDAKASKEHRKLQKKHQKWCLKLVAAVGLEPTTFRV